MLKELQRRVDELFIRHLGQTTLNLSWKTPAEAEEYVKNIELLLQELRLLKRELRSQGGQGASRGLGRLDSTVQDIDSIIMQLALAKVQIGKKLRATSSQGRGERRR